MKKLLLGLFIYIVFTNVAHSQSGYEIIVDLKNSNDTIAYLTYYQFDKTYIKDTCLVAKKGRFIFEGKTKLDTGIYSIVSQQKTIYFDFFVDEANQQLEFKNDKEPNDILGLNVMNSPSQSIFIDYLKFVNKQNINFINFKNNLALKTKSDTLLLIEKQKEVELEIRKYEQDFYSKNKSSFIGNVINLKIEKTLEEIPIASNGRPDSIKAYNYYKRHYWDNVNFTANESMKNPFFFNKLKKYFDSVVVQNPDSIIVEIDRILAKTNKGTDLKKVLLAHFINSFETSKIMGFDKVFVHLSDKYLKSGEGTGIYQDESVINSIMKRADLLKPLLLGAIAPELYLIKANDYAKINQMGFNNVKDSNDVTKKYYANVDEINKLFLTLHSVVADHIILVFWDVDCSHCQSEIPKLLEVYNDLKKANKSVKVVSVYTMHNGEKFLKYITDKGLTDWINAYDGVYINNLVNKYDIYSTPVIYILDKNKTIRAKRIGVDQIKNFIISINQ
jgi:thiol-disulfide isomerase/thioredoxin